MQEAKRLLASLLAVCVWLGFGALRAFAADEPAKANTLAVLNYVTGWTHDAVGYHPAIFILLENTSGRDLSNKLIRFQARFMDLHTAEVTIGRAEVRRELKPNQQFEVTLEGAQGYELPFETHLWPTIEVKAMCRIGASGDEGTETLTITKLDAVARTTAEAFEQLNQMTRFNPKVRSTAPTRTHNESHSSHTPHASHTAHSTHTPAHTAAHREPAPLVATAETVRERPRSNESALNLFNGKSLPGLGDDFYNFEQRFGLPQSTDAKRPDWTWAKYRHSATGSEIIAGAKERGGKVDIIVLKMPRSNGMDETHLVSAARQMAGKMKTQPMGPASRSVRYLPSGRLELVSSVSSGYKIVCMRPDASDSDNSFILVLSRVQQDTDVLLPTLPAKSSLLKCLSFLEQRD